MFIPTMEAVQSKPPPGSLRHTDRWCLWRVVEFADEAIGSVFYIEDDGTLSYSVILKALHLVMLNCKEQDIGIQVC